MRKIASLQVLRAFAALLVVVSHIWWDIAPYAGRQTLMEQMNLSNMGGFGVDVFFCLSGFIMMWCIGDEVPSIGKGAQFLGARIRRIYPIYGIWLLVALPYIWIHWANTSDAATPSEVVRNLLLLPSLPSEPNYRMLLPQAWTLVYEMYFYALFALCVCLLPKRHLAIGLGVVMLSIFGISHFIVGPGERLKWVNITWMIADPLTLNFLAGAVFARYLGQVSISVSSERMAPFFALAGVVIFLLSYYFVDGTRLLKFGVPAFVVLVLGCISALRDTPIHRVLVYLGDASYSIYITHIIVGWCAAYVASKIPGWPTTMLFAFSALAALFGCLSYSLIEKPINKRLHRRFARSRNGLAKRAI